MRFFRFPALFTALFAVACTIPAPAQKLTSGPPPANAPVAERRDAMNAYFQQYWDATL